VVEPYVGIDAKLLNHGDQHSVLVFEMAQNHLDLSFSPDIHVQIVLGIPRGGPSGSGQP